MVEADPIVFLGDAILLEVVADTAFVPAMVDAKRGYCFQRDDCWVRSDRQFSVLRRHENCVTYPLNPGENNYDKQTCVMYWKSFVDRRILS